MSRLNHRVIEEYRATGGKVTGPFAGMPLLLMTSIGARTGRPRTNPLTYLEHGGRLHVFGAHLGAPKHPDWYYNIVSEPQVTIELGADRFRSRGRRPGRRGTSRGLASTGRGPARVRGVRPKGRTGDPGGPT